MNSIPYTYLLKCIPINKFYYGVRYSKSCHPSDFWISYFTSSKIVKTLIKKYGKDAFVFEIRKQFSSANSAKQWEHRVLKKCKVLYRPNIWLNQTVGMSPPVLLGENNPSKRKDVRIKISEKLKANNPMKQQTTRDKVSKSIRLGFENGRKVWNADKINCFSEESRLKMSNSRKEKLPWNKGKKNIYSEETLKIMSEKKLGLKTGPKDIQTKSKISDARKNKKWYKNPNTRECICCFPGNQPSGWIPGMYKSIKPIPPHLKRK
jgi:hypothetical protein